MAAPPANEFELERDRRISRNLEVLQTLGLGAAAADGLRAKLSTVKLETQGPAAQRIKRPKVVRKIQAEAAEPVPARVSKRRRGEAPPTDEEIRKAVAREEEELSSARAAGTLRPALALQEGVAAVAPFTLRSVGTTVWHLGEIYRGPWAHRYWSNPACRYHAYPIGFKATKVQFGCVYHMQIEAGPQGPVFKVTEGRTGRVFAGASPTSPWTKVCLAQRTGQRISGPLFFGFSDPVTMRAIAALYSPQELQAAQQGSRVQGLPLWPAEAAAEEFMAVSGVTETVAIALATTNLLGGTPHASLASLRAWAGAPGNCALLQAFLLDSEELPVTTRKWQPWRGRTVPWILQALCGHVVENSTSPPPSPVDSSGPQPAEAPDATAASWEVSTRACDAAVQKENRHAAAAEAATPPSPPVLRRSRRPAKASARYRVVV